MSCESCSIKCFTIPKFRYEIQRNNRIFYLIHKFIEEQLEKEMNERNSEFNCIIRLDENINIDDVFEIYFRVPHTVGIKDIGVIKCNSKRKNCSEWHVSIEIKDYIIYPEAYEDSDEE
jgi:hypothetical protein